MTPDFADVVVVGAGPAGAAAAIAARRADPAARVLLLDAAEFPRDKVCGDGVAPHALDVLAELGVDTAALVAGTTAVPRLRLRSPGGALAARPFVRAAHVVPRLWFDERLVRVAVAAGAELRRHRVRTIRRVGAHLMVDDLVRARVVIGADGAESVVRRQVQARPPRAGTVAVAIRGYARVQPWPVDEQLLVLTRAHWPAYAWVFPVGDGTANVGYGELLRRPPPSRRALEQRLHALLPGLAGSTPDRLRGHRLPLSTGRPRFAHGDVLLVGDAASLINPLTGEGIYYAVESGRLAGTAAVGADPGRTYSDGMHQVLGTHLRQTDGIGRLGRWPALLDAGVAAAHDHRHVFDALVEVGLGAGRIDTRTAAYVTARVLRHPWRG